MVKMKIGERYITPLPERIAVTRKGGGAVYTLCDGTEIVVPSKAGLASVVFSSYTGDKSLLDDLKAAFRAGTPVRMSLTGIVSPVILNAVIVQLDTEEHGGNTEIVDYTIRLREYVAEKTTFLYDSTVFAQRNAQKNVWTGSGTGNGFKTGGKTYTVQRGDCLWMIAKKYLGDGALYPQIAALNGLANPNLIYPGQVIRLP